MTSLTSSTDDRLLEAEAEIAASSAMLADGGAGGVLHYRRAFPGDAYLRLWSGLVLRAQRRPALAIAEFEAARTLGLDHWRLSWYIASTARESGAAVLARGAFAVVAQAAPEFASRQSTFGVEETV